MTSPAVPEGVTVTVEGDTASASVVVAASPHGVFEFLRRPANHPAISGDATVKGTRVGPEVLGDGDRVTTK